MDAERLELELRTTLIKYKSASNSTGSGTAGAPDLEDAPSELGSIAEKYVRAEERAIAARELYEEKAGEKLDDSSPKILEVGGRYAFQNVASMTAMSVLTTYGVPPILAQFLGGAIGRAVSDAVLGPRLRAELFLDSINSLAPHLPESGVDGPEYLHEGCEDYTPMETQRLDGPCVAGEIDLTDDEPPSLGTRDDLPAADKIPGTIDPKKGPESGVNIPRIR